MTRLDRRDHGVALHLYRAAPARFPLMGAVLAGAQEGRVHVDDRAHPRAAYVEHAFGFAQVLGAPDAAFESALERHLLIDKAFAAPKVRLYTPHLPRFLDDPGHAGLRSIRQRFRLDAAASGAAGKDAMPAGTEVVAVDARNVDDVERTFGVVRRFWRSSSDFVAGSRAVLVLRSGRPASICYAAAEAEGEAEIDVATLPEHQRLGLGAWAVRHFARACLAAHVAPLWDCFTNNAGSMQLARAAGFVPAAPPYPFFTINR